MPGIAFSFQGPTAAPPESGAPLPSVAPPASALTRAPRVALLVPTLNASSMWSTWIAALQSQCLQPDCVLVIDSESEDDTPLQAKQAGYQVLTFPRRLFSHGGTRQRGVALLRGFDLLVCMTQDAVLADNAALQQLLKAFDDPRVAAAFGRQLPSVGASPIASHARQFNYPITSRTSILDDRRHMGIKASFMSNSFSAYRISDLLTVGGFPLNVILGEDTTVAARLLLAGKSIRYQADACVYHSHNYSPLEEFRRYFDTGVFHARERWLLDAFGGAGGEGYRFVTSEIRYLLNTAPRLIPSALFRTACKLAGYRLGRAEAKLPVRLKRHLSMFRGFWG